MLCVDKRENIDKCDKCSKTGNNLSTIETKLVINVIKLTNVKKHIDRCATNLGFENFSSHICQCFFLHICQFVTTFSQLSFFFHVCQRSSRVTHPSTLGRAVRCFFPCSCRRSHRSVRPPGAVLFAYPSHNQTPHQS